MASQASKLTEALFAIQKAVGGGVKRDAKNTHFDSEYATLGAVVRHVLPACEEHGVLLQMTTSFNPSDNTIYGKLSLIHVESGEGHTFNKVLPMGQKLDPQAAGSASTYCQRYLLQEVFLLPPVDDDGEAAMQRARSPLVNAKQLAVLNELLDQKGFTVAQACKSQGVQRLEDFRVANYDDLVERLKDRPDAEPT